MNELNNAIDRGLNQLGRYTKVKTKNLMGMPGVMLIEDNPTIRAVLEAMKGEKKTSVQIALDHIGDEMDRRKQANKGDDASVDLIFLRRMFTAMEENED